MGKLRQHAHRMRGAVAHMEGGEALADVCRDLETGAQQALDAAQALVEDLKLYLEAYPASRGSGG
ncbi:Hpt domain-containing protein [Cupriavidus basilensis]